VEEFSSAAAGARVELIEGTGTEVAVFDPRMAAPCAAPPPPRNATCAGGIGSWIPFLFVAAFAMRGRIRPDGRRGAQHPGRYVA
jgi:hypothetical protein